MSYRALYRVWRPQQFKDLVGQEHVTTTLQNALSSGQLAHAYLFHGPRGTGKTSAAKILAKAVNCEQGPAAEPCNQCNACLKITEGQMMDVVEIDAASNRGVDDIRELRDQVRYTPTEARYKVYMIDEAHMLTMEAFNALLKTLEEPPSHVLFILATTEPHKLLPTILSRCQRFAFRRISFDQIVATLEKVCQSEQVNYELGALRLLARAADGGLRDALSLLDQAFAFAEHKLDESIATVVTGSGTKSHMLQLLQAIGQQDVAKSISLLEQFISHGAEAGKILDDLIYACRDLLLVQTAPQLDRLQGIFDSHDEMQELHSLWSRQDLLTMLEILLSYQQQMNRVTQSNLLLEMVLIRLCQKEPNQQVESTDLDLDMLKKMQHKIDQLQQQINELRLQTTTSSPSTPQVVKTNHPSTDTTPPQAKSEATTVAVSRNRQAKTNHSPDVFQRVKAEWQRILQRVKELKITVHAWLVNGELKAATPEKVILVFSSEIHRQQIVERAENRKVIEQAIQEVLGQPFQLETIMADHWQESNEEAATVQDEMEPPTPPVVSKARQIFGPDLIEWLD
ncbi:DNA polymerase III, tau subunit [Seinonella peptonophila]|uniref:DNA-directed DNA polymerase n=1 Tax=Seinonella peptonophila TaxID=112248 RepID=A0A1M4XBH9_9BACL|nr:DNA polymerase III subunit gamma/tau [Seinonella peptonophila]SHE90542.1 DNA polymerase III, tau subunit [Seinonella peptonophila]